jgi:peptidoglycan/xylan/chitin deacetylase (PgdA/CDA1 family)
LAEEKVKEQIAKTDEVIERVYSELGEQRPAKYFRFPYGRTFDKEANQQLLRQYGYWSPIDPKRSDWPWDVHVEDWKVDASNVDQKLESAKKKMETKLHRGNILLLHDHLVNFELGLSQRICQHVLDLGLTFCTNEDLQEQALTGPRYCMQRQS